MEGRISKSFNQDFDVDYLRGIEVHPVKNLTANYQETVEELEKVDGVTIVYKDDEAERIVALIDHYNASVRIGSRNWCIASVTYGGSLGNANGVNYWWAYLGDKDHRQYFVWDFKQTEQRWQLVGTTTDEKENKFYCAYNYPNMAFSMEAYIEENGWDRDIFFNNDERRGTPHSPFEETDVIEGRHGFWS